VVPGPPGGPKRQSWGSQTQIWNINKFPPFASNSLQVAFVYTLRTLSHLASHSSSVFSSFLFSLVYLFGRAAVKVETTVRLPGERFLLTLFRSAYFFNFDLGVPDDIGRVQEIPAVKKVKNHWSNVTVQAGAKHCNKWKSRFPHEFDAAFAKLFILIRQIAPCAPSVLAKPNC